MFGPKSGGIKEGGGWDDATKRAYEKAVSETGRESGKKYRIAWKETSGHSGHGEYMFDEKEAHELARAMNEEHKGRINHWTEREP